MAGPFDFTGQNIEDSYQRVLQTDGNLVYDGTGSLVTIASAVTSSYPITITGSSLYSTAPATSNISNNGVIAFGANADELIKDLEDYEIIKNK
jgi:L-asparaginase/Glu-tRNA(Gln) amidotransferase subunit D